MVKSFTAQVQDAIKKQERKLLYVQKNALQDVLEAAMTGAKGVSKGGTLIEGRIPIAESDLIKSLSTNGGPPSETSYVAMIAGMRLGQTMEFAWTVEYALRIELGFKGTDKAGRTFNAPGWHFVGRAAERFDEFVANREKEVA